MSTEPPSTLTDAWDAEIAAYRPLSKLAILGLVWGVLSATAVVDPSTWPVPALGIVINGLALWLIARNSTELLGRKAALIGLVLSILFAVAGPTQRYSYRFMLDREARRFARAWFEFLSRGEVLKAHQLTLRPEDRSPLDDGLDWLYDEIPERQEQIKRYRNEQPVRTLQALGERALVRYFQTESMRRDSGKDVVYQLYAVTFDDADEKKTFFVRLELHRLDLADGRANWMIELAVGDVVPKGW